LFFSWVLNGIVHALVIFYIGYHTFKSDVFWSHGRVGNLRCFGTAVNIMSLVAFGGSLVMLSTFMFSYCLTSPASPVVRVDAEMADIILDILYSPQIILFIIIATFVAISIDILFNAIQRLLYNSLHDEALSKQLIMGKKIDALSESFTKVRQFMMRTSESALNLVNHPFKTRELNSFFDEGAIVPQSDIVRIYDSRMPKQAGSSIRSERSFRYSDRLLTVDTSSLQMEKHFSNDDDVSEWNNLSKTFEFKLLATN
uniref:PhoLip_ATPase_C domain-containing protein n=1 Tax=Anisakis simplex TaxID=6269 RepID=A0A0M3K5I4_ANISI